MPTEILLLLGNMILTVILFFISLCYVVHGNIKGVQFMSFGLLNMAISCAILLYNGDSYMSLDQTSNLARAALVLLGLSALLNWAYQGSKKVS